MFNVYIYIFDFFILWPDDGPSWGRKCSALNKYNHKFVLFVTGDYLDHCDSYSNGDFPNKIP